MAVKSGVLFASVAIFTVVQMDTALKAALAESRGRCFTSCGHGGRGLIVIRNALEQEAEALAAIGLRAWRQATAALGITATLYDNAASAFSNFTRSSWLAIRVAESGGSVAGWAAREHFDETISDFWIDPDFQRRRVGSLLLADIERLIVDKGFETIRLETHAQNEPAVAFSATMAIASAGSPFPTRRSSIAMCSRSVCKSSLSRSRAVFTARSSEQGLSAASASSA